MHKYFTKLKHSIIDNYVDRKHDGMLSLFYNVKNKSFIVIPMNVEHVDFVALLLNVTLDDIMSGRVDASHFIPVSLVINNNEYASVIIGVSSLEMGCEVRHRKGDLINAKNATYILLQRGPLKIKRDFKEFVSMKYAL